MHVASLERSIVFYRAVFGLRPAERLSVGAEQIAFLEAPSSHVELIADGTAGRQTGVVDHLALEVDDLDAWLARLRERGVPLLDEAPIEVPALGARILFCLGPDGERIELFEQRAPEPAVPGVPPADAEKGPLMRPRQPVSRRGALRVLAGDHRAGGAAMAPGPARRRLRWAVR